MSLLLDALKKSEAQRRRGTSPTIDLTRTPPSGSSRRPARRWLLVALAGVFLVAATPWLWPHVSDWVEGRRGDGDEPGALAEVTDTRATAATAEPGSAGELSGQGPAKQAVPAPVAGASSARRVAADTSTPGVEETGGGPDRVADGDGADSPTGAPTGTDSGAGAGAESAAPGAAAASSSGAGPSMRELQRRVQSRQEQQQEARSSAPEPDDEPSGPANNFIRPWELPQAQRAEFPELQLTVHFYADREADRFVLINGERYREGQRVGPGATLAEIRRRGAVVEFGSYRVLIE